MEVKEARALYDELCAVPPGAVSPGYRQTEVGVIPEDWEVRKLKKISPSQSVGLVINPSSYYADEGTVPMLVGSNIEPNHINWESARRISDASNGLIPASRLSAGDLVTVRVGEPGMTAVVPPELDGCNCASMMIVRKGPAFDSEWLCYTMNSWLGLRQVEHVQYGTAQKQFNISDAVHFSYPFPPLLEQEAIAGVLSDADALIESLEQLIAKKRQIKQGTMQALLTGKQRLPGFEGKWEIKRLEQAGCCLRGVSYRGDSDLSLYDTAHTKRLLRSNNVQEAAVVTTDVQYVNEDRVSDSQILQKGDILICMANGSKALVGKSGLFNVDDGYEYTFGAFMGCFRTHSERANSAFIFSLFQTRQYRSYINNLLAGSSINNLRPSSIESLEFSFPEIPEQTAIATILSDMDTELAGLETRLAKTRQLKQGMMQELLTGRIRLV
jgi:type I restriction enzyme S subunit